MTVSRLRSGVLAGAALAVTAAFALPAWSQSTTGSQSGAPTEVAPAPAEQATQQPAASGEAASDREPAAAAGASETATAAEAAAGDSGGYVLGDVALGAADAPLTIYEYASFTCPHCAAFHTETFPEFKEKYIDTGKVRFVLREVYFDQYGLWASMVARCGGEQGFYPLVDSFLTTQSSWTRAPDIGHAIQQVGLRAGLPSDRLQQCLADREFAKKLLETYQANREADDVTSTPTFIIDGEKHTGEMPFEAFAAIVDEAL